MHSATTRFGSRTGFHDRRLVTPAWLRGMLYTCTTLYPGVQAARRRERHGDCGMLRLLQAEVLRSIRPARKVARASADRHRNVPSASQCPVALQATIEDAVLQLVHELSRTYVRSTLRSMRQTPGLRVPPQEPSHIRAAENQPCLHLPTHHSDGSTWSEPIDIKYSSDEGSSLNVGRRTGGTAASLRNAVLPNIIS
jgi:hypothetical protein